MNSVSQKGSQQAEHPSEREDKGAVSGDARWHETEKEGVSLAVEGGSCG
jgi:hypothetical protein